MFFGDKQLSEVNYDDLMAFLEEGREEGVRLDYKESWTEKITETACAFANTYGGYVLYGVKEIEDQPSRPNQPDPQDIPGIDFSKGDPVASLRSKILDNTRPPVEPEIHTVPLEGSEDRGVLIVGIEESMDAPHEVLTPGANRIPMRRADTTVAASLDEIERLINRRESQRRDSEQPLDVQFFSERFATPHEWGGQRSPPIVGVAVRPRRLNSLGFAFDATFDERLRHIALNHEIGNSLRPKPTPLGLAMEDSEEGFPSTRVEVHKSGKIFCARVLSSETRSPTESLGSEEGAMEEKWLDFGEVSYSLCAMIRFASEAYALRRPGVEMEVWFGLRNCQGHRTKLPVQSPFRSYPGQVPGNDFSVIGGNFINTRGNGKPTEEAFLSLIRETSRFFQISVPDERLRYYFQ